MTSQLLLHIGPHKTGTSTLQQVLAANRRTLTLAGWHYETFDGVAGGQHGVADLLDTGRIAQAAEATAGLAGRAPRCVISSENFSRLDATTVGPFLDAAGYDDVTVVYYLRNPLSRMASNWHEKVKHGYAHTFTEYLGARFIDPVADRDISDVARLEPWIDAAQRVAVHLYDVIDDIAGHFLSRHLAGAGIEVPGSARVNQSAGMTFSEVLRALRGHQVFLPRAPEYLTDLRELARFVDENLSGFQYPYRLSLDEGAPAELERTIVKRLAPYLVDADRDPLFTVRERTWRLSSPDLWIHSDEARRRLHDIRSKLDVRFGSPALDRRLAPI